MRNKKHLTVAIAVLATALVPFALRTAQADATSQNVAPHNSVVEPQTAVPSHPVETTKPEVPTAPVPSPAVTQPNLRVLDWPRQFALGMIETGNDDRAVGGAGEVSRYQIMPTVWQHYNSSRSYRDPAMSLNVAKQHWATLYDYFKKKTQREPTDFDMYVLWNTRQGYYARRGFNPSRLHPMVRDGAQRFCNLVELGLRREAEHAPDKRV